MAGLLDRPPLVVAPYDAELFGHWWYEGPEFLDYLARKLCYDQKIISLITPGEYLRAASDEPDRHAERVKLGRGRLPARVAERKKRMDLSAPAGRAGAHDQARARNFRRRPASKRARCKQAARELLLAQASDWPFILRAGTSPDYARRRVKDHLLRFIALHDQLTATSVDEKWLRRSRVARQPFSGRGLELLEVALSLRGFQTGFRPAGGDWQERFGHWGRMRTEGNLQKT